MSDDPVTPITRRGLVHQRGCGAGPEPCTCEAPFPLGREEAADLIERLSADHAAVRRWIASGGMVSMKRWFEGAEDVAAAASIALSHIFGPSESGRYQGEDS